MIYKKVCKYIVGLKKKLYICTRNSTPGMSAHRWLGWQTYLKGVYYALF